MQRRIFRKLSEILHVGAQDVLRQLVQQNRIARELISDLFLYTAIDPATRQRRRMTRRSNQSFPTVVDASRLEVSPDDMTAAIILFYSLLGEQQRRLYPGLESIKLGHGGDSVLAEFLALDPHAMARGQRQLLDQDVELGRTRQSGAGRKEKAPEVIDAIEILLEHDTRRSAAANVYRL